VVVTQKGTSNAVMCYSLRTSSCTVTQQSFLHGLTSTLVNNIRSTLLEHHPPIKSNIKPLCRANASANPVSVRTMLRLDGFLHFYCFY
jgi:hypothetical protein